ncbi:hypothetical protein FC093_09650 [Ilyomonas limi]|uniref:Outer membrane protein beta-barrel domain-containing protein n=1 Tax=Ilyomonas limi TaxID=2575867 RepID=A0A4U3L1S0_9BACT|nr:DUF6089 family protein [Ilyomonas limi]TKK68948.1 hypothetical protein FC093_09650 [Ilyomonas limi]
MFTKTLHLVLACAALLMVHRSTAQYSNYIEPMQDIRGSSGINFDFGTNTFLGDLGGTKGLGKPFAKDFNSKTIRPYLGVSYTYFPYKWLSVKGGLHYTLVTGADSLITNKQGNARGRFDRNLSFKSGIEELSAEVEWYPLQLIPRFEEARVRPFIGSGIGLFHFNPKAKLAGKWYDLKPLHLEGQGFTEYPEQKNYKLIQPYLPITMGVKYRISNSYFISLSGCFRKTFTDYIDDVSTTYIDPNLFDKYLSPANATIAKQLYYRGLNGENSTLWPRGYASKDSYTSFFFTITYLFDNRRGYDYIGN